jgi:hypothetical protein
LVDVEYTVRIEASASLFLLTRQCAGPADFALRFIRWLRLIKAAPARSALILYSHKACRITDALIPSRVIWIKDFSDAEDESNTAPGRSTARITPLLRRQSSRVRNAMRTRLLAHFHLTT